MTQTIINQQVTSIDKKNKFPTPFKKIVLTTTEWSRAPDCNLPHSSLPCNIITTGADLIPDLFKFPGNQANTIENKLKKINA